MLGTKMLDLCIFVVVIDFMQPGQIQLLTVAEFENLTGHVLATLQAERRCEMIFFDRS
jgi:hypothetical protein